MSKKQLVITNDMTNEQVMGAVTAQRNNDLLQAASRVTFLREQAVAEQEEITFRQKQAKLLSEIERDQDLYERFFDFFSPRPSLFRRIRNLYRSLRLQANP